MPCHAAAGVATDVDGHAGVVGHGHMPGTSPAGSMCRAYPGLSPAPGRSPNRSILIIVGGTVPAGPSRRCPLRTVRCRARPNPPAHQRHHRLLGERVHGHPGPRGVGGLGRRDEHGRVEAGARCRPPGRSSPDQPGPAVAGACAPPPSRPPRGPAPRYRRRAGTAWAAQACGRPGRARAPPGRRQAQVRVRRPVWIASTPSAAVARPAHGPRRGSAPALRRPGCRGGSAHRPARAGRSRGRTASPRPAPARG